MWRELDAPADRVVVRDATTDRALLTLTTALAVARPTLRMPPSLDALTDTALAAARRLRAPDHAADFATRVARSHALAGRVSEACAVCERALAEDLGERRIHVLLTLANLELTSSRLAQADARTAEIVATLRNDASLPTAQRDAYRALGHELRGRLQLALGLVDLAHTSFDAVARLLGPDAPRTQMLRLEEALAAEDFARAHDLATALTDAPPPGVARDEIELRKAIAAARTATDPTDGLAEARRLLERTLANAKHAATRCRIAIRHAGYCLDGGDVDAARRSLARARDEFAAADADGVRREIAAIAVVGARCLLATPSVTREELERNRDELLAAQSALLVQWEEIAPRPGGIGYLQFGSRRDVTSALISIERRLTADDASAAFARLAAVQGLGGLSRRFRLAAPSLADVQRVVPDDGGMLVYLRAGAGSHVFALTRGDLTNHELGPMPRLRADVRTLRDELRTRLPADAPRTLVDARARRLRDAATEMQRELLPDADAARIATWRSIVVVGREQLGGVPFECLPGTEREWLGLERAIAYAPSLPVAVELHRRHGEVAAADDELDLVAIAATGEGPAERGLPPIDVTPSELDAVVGAFASVRTVVGSDATPTKVRDIGAQSPARAWLLLAHGVGDAATVDDERPTALQLHAVADATAAPSDGLLRCRDVESLTSAPPLVLLAACSAAAGPERRGDDHAADLVGAFLAAGALTVVAADADLDVGASLSFFRTVCGELAAGRSVAEAVRAGRVALADDPRYADPRFHASLHVTGIGDAPLPFRMRTSSSALATTVLIGGGILAVLIGRARRRG